MCKCSIYIEKSLIFSIFSIFLTFSKISRYFPTLLLLLQQNNIYYAVFLSTNININTDMLQFWMAYLCDTVSSPWRFLSAPELTVTYKQISVFFLSTEIYITSLSLTAISNIDIWMAYWCAVTNYNCTFLCPAGARSAPPQTGGALQKSRGTVKKNLRRKSCPSTFNLLPVPLLQPKSNLVHFSFKIWRLVAAITMIFLRISLPNVLSLKEYQGRSGPLRTILT